MPEKGVKKIMKKVITFGLTMDPGMKSSMLQINSNWFVTPFSKTGEIRISMNGFLQTVSKMEERTFYG
jgi:hypothetical protein